MLALAAIPWIALGWLPYEWEAFLGGMSFLVIPQLLSWGLFVGLKTGRMPAREEPILRTESPRWFWAVAAMYGGVLAYILYIIAMVLTDIAADGN
ncbi:MAG: hypothetical protein AB7U35_08630 [Sphingobium sp.]